MNFPAGTNNENYQRKQALCRTTSNVPNSMPSQQQQQQQQHLVPPNLLHHQPHQYRLVPGQHAVSASTSPTNNMIPHMHQQQQQQQQFSKSHSIDNLLPREIYQPVNYSNNNLWNQQGQPTDSSIQHESPDMSLNLHKKLQRQLSLLNPFDPRLYPMQRYPNAPQLVQGPTSPTAHKPLSSSHSLTGGTLAQNQQHPMYEHQVNFQLNFCIS